ncbi:MAG: zinc ribbon domain-containing protein, partial [Prevotella sp.]|nr:zinc ribbon domain-containing protein [Prevotella sp.]
PEILSAEFQAGGVTMPMLSMVDTIILRRHDRLVVADIKTVPADSIDSVWVKVARDQLTFGWVHESDLLANVSPDDPISQFIDSFSDSHLLIFLGFCVLVGGAYGLRRLLRKGAKIVHFNDIPSFYPTLLCLLVASSAVLYSSIQLFAPESWRHLYYHPSLNPYALPWHLGLFVTSVWAIVIVAIATIDDVRHHLPLGQVILYLGGLAAVCAVDYVIFSVTTLYYIGYPLLIAYFVFAIYRLSLQKSL